MVDERDFWILTQLRKNPFSSYETLGRGIGLSGNAVKARLEALERAGVLTSLNGMPAAQIFRRLPRLIFFRQPVTLLEKFHAAIEIDPAVFATIDVNGKVGVLLYESSPSESSKSLELLSKLLGPIETEATPRFPYPHKELLKPLSLVDLKVLRELVSNLRLPLKDISRITGLSQKVVKKSRKELMENGLMQVQPIFQSAQSSRILMYEIHVRSNDDSVLARIRQTLPKSVFLNQWEQKTIILSSWADSISEVFETEKKLRDEPGVTDVLVKFHARAVLSTSRLISWLDEEIARLQERRSKA